LATREEKKCKDKEEKEKQWPQRFLGIITEKEILTKKGKVHVACVLSVGILKKL